MGSVADHVAVPAVTIDRGVLRVDAGRYRLELQRR